MFVEQDVKLLPLPNQPLALCFHRRACHNSTLEYH